MSNRPLSPLEEIGGDALEGSGFENELSDVSFFSNDADIASGHSRPSNGAKENGDDE